MDAWDDAAKDRKPETGGPASVAGTPDSWESAQQSYQPLEGSEGAKSESGLEEGQIPLTSHLAATEQGLANVGEGAINAVSAIPQAIMHPFDTLQSLHDAPGKIWDAGKKFVNDVRGSNNPYETALSELARPVGNAGGAAVVGAASGELGKAPWGRIGKTIAGGIADQPIINKFTEAWKANGPPEVGAHSPVMVKPGPDVLPREMMPKIGATQRIPVRPGIEPIGAGSAAEGGGQISEPATSLIPEPRAPFPGENPNYAASIPREELEGLAKIGKPGAGTQLQQLGGVHGRPVLYIPREAEFPTSVRARQILNEFGQPVDQSSTVERIEPIRKKRAENE